MPAKRITFTPKKRLDQLEHTEVNSLREVANDHADLLDALNVPQPGRHAWVNPDLSTSDDDGLLLKGDSYYEAGQEYRRLGATFTNAGVGAYRTLAEAVAAAPGEWQLMAGGSSASLPAASPSTRGGVRVGAGLAVSGDLLGLAFDSATLGLTPAGALYVLASSGNISVAATPTHVTAVRDHPRTRTRVSWDPMPGATFYQVYRSAEGGPFSLLAGIPYPYFNDNSSAGQGDGYVLYYVVAANGAGESPPSAYAQAA